MITTALSTITIVIGSNFFFPVQVKYFKEYGRVYVKSVEYKGQPIKNLGNHLDKIIETIQTIPRHE